MLKRDINYLSLDINNLSEVDGWFHLFLHKNSWWWYCTVWRRWWYSYVFVFLEILVAHSFAWLFRFLHTCYSSDSSLSKHLLHSSISIALFTSEEENTFQCDHQITINLLQIKQRRYLFAFETVGVWFVQCKSISFVIFRFPNIILTRLKQCHLKQMTTLSVFGMIDEFLLLLEEEHESIACSFR